MAQTLQRTLSLSGAVALTVGFVVGGSIFVLIPAMAGMTGPSLFLAYLLSAVPAIFAAFYLVQLGAVLPVTGANYIAVTRWVSPVAGFVSSLSAGIAMISSNCLVAWGFAEYLATYIPALPTTVYAVGIIILFGLLNWTGIKTFEKTQIPMLIIFMMAMLLFGVAGLFNIEPAYQTPLFPKGLGNFFMVVAVASFSWLGVIAIIEVAGEVKHPKRNIPLSIAISMGLICLLYLVQTYAFTGTQIWSESERIGPTAVLVAAAGFLPAWCVHFIALGALMAMATTVNSMILIGSREIFIWSCDLILPPVFQRINPKFHTPELGILFFTTLSVISVLFAASIEKYALMVVFALMVIQIFGATAVLRMPTVAPALFQKAPLQFTPFWRWFIWGGCMVFFLGIFAFGVLADYKTCLVFLSVCTLSLLYWFWRNAHLQKQGISLKAQLQNISDVREKVLEMN